MNDIAKSENKPATKKKTLQELINSPTMMEQIGRALPRHIKPDYMVRVMLTTLQKVPKLADCTQESLLSSLMTCSELGIAPDGRRAHLIPYGTTCQLIVDYKGLVELVRRSGEVADIHADVVCENDSFSFSFGSGSHLRHIPELGNRGKVIAAYSFCRLKDGSESFEVLSIDEIEKVRKGSKAGNTGPWRDHWNEMAKKTAFRRHSKWLPLSPEVADNLYRDDDTPASIQATVGGAPYDAEGKGAESLAGRLTGALKDADPAEELTFEQAAE
jgi:recombination protein RecT